MNLIDFGFQNSNLFQHMPLFDEITYAGHNEEKVRQYKAVHEGQSCNLLALNFIRNDEKMLWDAHAELSTVIINTASKLAPGEIKMIKYSSVYALIHKTIASDWGKINFKTAVDAFKDKPDYLDLLIKQILKGYIFSRDPVMLLLNDLSQNPIFDLKNETQQARIKKVIVELIPNSIEFIPEVYIQDKNGAIELLSGNKL